MSRILYIAKRFVLSLFLLFGVITVLFFFFRMLPGDYATVMAGDAADPQTVEALREEWGLHDPLYLQYYHYLENMATGSAGESHRHNLPVWDVVRPALINSLILVVPAIVFVYLLGTLYGGIVGRAVDSVTEKFGSLPPLFVGTFPDFFIGMALIAIFAGALGLFPSQGMAGSDTFREYGGDIAYTQLFLLRDFWWHYTLPFLTVVLKYLYYPTLIMRSSVIQVRDQDFMYFHEMTGISRRLQFVHLLKHASLPVITAFPITMATSFSGLVLIEFVFNWPGIGKLLFDSVLARDTPVIQFIFLMIAAWIIAANFVVDILYGVIDPRITVGSEGE